MKAAKSALLTEAQTDPLLTPSEVAEVFRVDVKTINRWAKAGKLAAYFTAGKHRRYRESVVRALLEAHLNPPAQ